MSEEPGTLQAVAELARDWFATHLTAAAVPAPPARRRVDQPAE